MYFLYWYVNKSISKKTTLKHLKKKNQNNESNKCKLNESGFFLTQPLKTLILAAINLTKSFRMKFFLLIFYLNIYLSVLNMLYTLKVILNNKKINNHVYLFVYIRITLCALYWSYILSILRIRKSLWLYIFVCHLLI